MKNLYLLSFLFLANIGISQVSEIKADLSLGEQNAYVVDHPDAEKKMVEKVLDNTFKQYGKVKKNRKAKEWNCAECTISMISGAPLSIYYKVEEGKGQITSYTFFDDGTKFISSENNSKASAIIEKLNKEIALDVKRLVIEKELENQEKELKNFEKDLSKLEKKNKNLHDDIEDYKEKIRKAEKEIEENLNAQADKKMEIEKQRNEVASTTDRLNNVGRN